MSYVLGKRSRQELRGVDPGVVEVVERAIIITKQDFSVHDGLRTVEEQAEYVRTGVSKTMNSRHLTGYAVDLVPYVNGKLRWEWKPIFVVTDAVQQACQELGVRMRWGAVWDRCLNDLSNDLEGEVTEYGKRRRAAGKKPFLDGPHYERYK